jgi:hypothetical protein
MVIFATVIFFFSLLLIGALFALKLRELRQGRHPLAEWRTAADVEAVKLRELALAADLDLRKVPSLLSHFAQVALHFAALEFAQLARQASRRAHALADFVSHKRNFERRATRSEFLRKMSELKNGEAEVGQRQEERVEF